MALACRVVEEEVLSQPAPAMQAWTSRLAASQLIFAFILLGTEVPAKIQEVTLMRPIHGNL